MIRGLHALSILLSFCLLGCVGVMRAPQRTRSGLGPTANVDLSFMKPAQTSRSEVLEKLKAVDTGFRSDRFFVGRWCTSKWVAFVGFAYQGPGTVSADRMWHAVNLLVEFDGRGVVRTFEVFPSKMLPAKLARLAPEVTVTSGDEIVSAGQASVESRRLTHLILTPESLEITQLRNHKNVSYKVPAKELSGIAPAHGADDNPDYVAVDLHFSHDLETFGGHGGNKLPLQITVPQVIVLLRYASDHQNHAITPGNANLPSGSLRPF